MSQLQPSISTLENLVPYRYLRTYRTMQPKYNYKLTLNRFNNKRMCTYRSHVHTHHSNKKGHRENTSATRQPLIVLCRRDFHGRTYVVHYSRLSNCMNVRTYVYMYVTLCTYVISIGREKLKRGKENGRIFFFFLKGTVLYSCTVPYGTCPNTVPVVVS